MAKRYPLSRSVEARVSGERTRDILFLQFSSERKFMGFMHGNYSDMFPDMVDQKVKIPRFTQTVYHSHAERHGFERFLTQIATI